VYCDFSIAVRRSVPAERFVSAVLAELDSRLESEAWDAGPIETLYLGGGTPSLLPTEQLTRLIAQLVERGGGAGPTELTLEANPDDVTPQRARSWATAGVSRVSLGVQSFDQRTLEWMHRTHEAAASEAAVTDLRAAGIGSVSLDLIFALPDDLEPDLGAELDRALALEPDHLAVYGLTVEPRTPLARWMARGAAARTDEERYVEEFLLAHEVLAAAGFEHYEVSNYAKPGQRSRHNGIYWAGAPYLGLGPSAHSFRDGERRWNVEPWAAWERAVRERGEAVAGTEQLTADQRHLEGLYLGLRTIEGVAPEAVPPGLVPALKAAEERGWIVERAGRLALTPEGWLKLDSLVTA
jgi:oxygen-independent coproporphyrinogen-3 oxidase